MEFDLGWCPASLQILFQKPDETPEFLALFGR